MLIRKQINKLKRRGLVALEYLTLAGVVLVPIGYFADDYTASMRRQSAELSAGIQSLNQSYSVPTQRGCGAAKPGSMYVDPSASTATIQYQTHACN